ncbi:aldehyde dehydrogenase PuuC, partial [Oceanisphaera arctica]
MEYRDKAYWQAQAKELTIEHRLFIAGEYQEARGGESFTRINPATEQRLAEVSRAQAADVDAAVAVARLSFESGVWSEAGPSHRKAVLLRLAELMDEHREELALLETLD